MPRMGMLTLIGGLALAACGGGDQAEGDTPAAQTAATADLDPCSLITAAEMAAITTDAVTGTDRQDRNCRYRSNPNDGVEVVVRPTGGAEAMETVRQTAKLLGGMGASVAHKGGAGADVADLLKEDKSAAPALGDEAMWGANDTLSVRKGDAFVEVTPPLMHDPATHPGYPLVKKEEKRKIATDVAKLLVERLSR